MENNHILDTFVIDTKLSDDIIHRQVSDNRKPRRTSRGCRERRPIPNTVARQLPCMFLLSGRFHMPCRDERDEAPYMLRECQERLNKVTALLCGLCESFEEAEEHWNPIQEGSPNDELVIWWEAHKKQDASRIAAKQAEEKREAERVAAEKKRQETIRGLTPEQREALGF